ncbi:MAG: Glycosyl transferase, group 2 family protein [uncultured bacterium]|nr:MAG: Glycosyl transferase, group 2 family protein [uncultured bacterium]
MHISTKNKIKNFGISAYCPVCGSFLKKFIAVEDRKKAICPVCGSYERHRLVWLYFKRETGIFSGKLKMLHIAPENCFVRRFKQIPNLDYISIDLESKLADKKMSLTKLEFEDECFDIVYCSHVLEHITDDIKAMSEIKRTLKKGGMAIIMVPVFGEVTEEDLNVTAPEERKRLYGQSDHVRKYGEDFVSRLETAGLKVQTLEFYKKFLKIVRLYYGLSDEKIYICRK